MKKKVRSVLLLALAVMMAVSAAGCSGGTKTADMDVAKVMDAMLEKAPIEGGIELSQDDMLNFYGIQSEDMEAFAANLAADGITAKEIVLVKAKDEDSAKTVESKLQSRLDARRNEFNNYLPDQYAIVEKSEVKRDGVYVRLIISPQQDEPRENGAAHVSQADQGHPQAGFRRLLEGLQQLPASGIGGIQNCRAVPGYEIRKRTGRRIRRGDQGQGTFLAHFGQGLHGIQAAAGTGGGGAQKEQGSKGGGNRNGLRRKSGLPGQAVGTVLFIDHG